MSGFYHLVDVRHLKFPCFACRDAVRCGVLLCSAVLPDIERNLFDGKCRKTLRGAYLPLDNARAHNAKRSRQEIARTKAPRAVHPAYSCDAAPSDFFLFGRLKGEMAGLTANSPAETFSEMPGLPGNLKTDPCGCV
jgi:hypothetical protein